MNKIVLFFLTLITVLIYSQCAVINSNTGLLTFCNLSDKNITNIKLGNTIIKFFLSPGEVYDYYFTGNIGGKMEGEGIDVVSSTFLIQGDSTTDTYAIYKDNSDVYFKPNFKYNLDIIKLNDKYKLKISNGVTPGSSSKDPGFDFPGV